MKRTLLCLAVALLFSCSSSKKSSNGNTSQTNKIPEFVIEKRFMSNFFSGQSAFIREDFQTAQKNFAECLKYQPENPEILFRLSQTESKLGNNDKAFDLIEKAIKFDKEGNLWYYIYYSEILKESGNLKNSASQLLIAINKNPREKFLYARTDSAFREIDELDKSEQVWEKFKTNFPDERNVFNEKIIEIYKLQNKPEALLNNAKELFELDNSNGKYVSVFAESLLANNKKQELVELLGKYSDFGLLNSFKFEFYKTAYFISKEIENKNLTAEYVSAALGLKTDNELLNEFIKTVKDNYFEKYSLAENLIKTAAENPQNSDLQLITGIQLSKEGKFEKAIKYFENSKNLGNTSSELYVEYCEALYKSGNLNKLKKISEEALMLYPFSEELNEYYSK